MRLPYAVRASALKKLSIQNSPPAAKFIKLGTKGSWEDRCLSDGTARLAFYEASHEDALRGDRTSLEASFLETGRSPRTATDFARQVLEFYHAEPDTIWITFSRGRLWWCQLDGPVEFLGSDPVVCPNGSRLRRSVNGWSDTSIAGKPLLISELNGNLTAVSQFRGTICDVIAADYLLRKIHDQQVPEVIEAEGARAACLRSIQTLVALLPWHDFEILVDLVFSRSGWRRKGALGGTQKTVDLELELPVTGENAFVQVKSRTDQNELDRYIANFQYRYEERLFFVYHSATRPLQTSDIGVSVIGPEKLSEMIFEAGLFDWLLSRCA